ncbi:hypothetical protein BD414DRAFT_514819 [Trametes punicea]|nr:hypothetical protein BD414DRAFT_514819 [Trametes punicea]
MYQYHHSRTALLMLVSAWLSLSSAHVRAAPTSPTSRHPRLRPRQNQTSGDNTTAPPSLPGEIWIPLVVVGLLFVVGLVFACGSRRFRGWSMGWGNGAAQAAGIAGAPNSGRESDTAQSGQTNAASGGNTNAARRPRRTRRTPSQISTHSLPAYNKEPGEQEIVVVRGLDDMDDMSMPITVTMPAVDEHGTESPEGSIDLTGRASVYVPLLHGNEYDARQYLNAEPDGVLTRRSFDSNLSSEDNSQGQYLDEAPPYEAVVLDSAADLPSTTSQPPLAPASAGTSAASALQEERSSADQSQSSAESPRRSLFMSIFHPRHSRVAPSSVPTNAGSPEPRSTSGHTRQGSGPSIASVAPSDLDAGTHPYARPRNGNHNRHQASHSGSGSMFSLISRTRSNQNLAGAGGTDEGLSSPSLISLNSISAPLSHTLVRTEFTYPPGGPTPEQLRLISSRDSFARFGVPYGPDAIAFASSASRVELEPPPPGFEEVAGESTDAPEAAVSQRGESPGPEAVLQTQSEGAGNGSNSEASELLASASAPMQERPADAETAETETPFEDRGNPAAPATQSSSVAADASGAPPASSATSPALLNAPPSAFRTAFITDSDRAASRASSNMTFATAEESIRPSEPPTPSASQFDLHPSSADEYKSAAKTPVDGSTPSTPRLASRHVHESTDMTVTPDRR